MTKQKTLVQKKPSSQPSVRPRAPRQGLLSRGGSLSSSGSDVANEPHSDVSGDEDTQWVSAVARAVQVLNAFRPGDPPLGNVELAERTGLAKPTVSRLAYTLSRCGYLTFNARYRVYELGPAAITLGHVAMTSVSVRQLARPLMSELANQASFNVGLGTLDQQSMVYTDAFEGTALIGVRLFAGSRLPVLDSAMGRAYLVGLDMKERAAALDGLQAHDVRIGPSEMRTLERALAEFRAHGFCSSFGDWHPDVCAVSAPIRSPRGGPCYAVNLGGPSYVLSKRRLLDELGPRIAELARKVEATVSPWTASTP